jgi:hypothetical protein
MICTAQSAKKRQVLTSYHRPGCDMLAQKRPGMTTKDNKKAYYGRFLQVSFL